MSQIRVFNTKRDGIKFQMGSAYSWRVLNPDVGVNEISVNYGEHAPGIAFKQHTHPHSVDIIMVLSGTGVIKSGDKEMPIGPGDVVYVPPGVVHGTVNTGNEPLVMYGCQVPPDPGLYAAGEKD